MTKYLILLSDAPMKMVSLASKYTVNESKNLTLHCKVQSNPLAKIDWYKDGSKIGNSSKFTVLHEVVSNDKYHGILSSQLYMRGLNKSDSGNYTCNSSNQIGSSSEEGRLVVNCECIWFSQFIELLLLGTALDVFINIAIIKISKNFNIKKWLVMSIRSQWWGDILPP